MATATVSAGPATGTMFVRDWNDDEAPFTPPYAADASFSPATRSIAASRSTSAGWL